MKKIHHIELVFENVTSLSIDAKYIGTFFMGSFSTEVYRYATNAIGMMQKVEEVEIELFSEGNDIFDEYGIREKTKFARLQEWNDITAIELHYWDKGMKGPSGEFDTFYPLYDEGNRAGVTGAPNINQVSKLSNLGNLYLSIHPDNGSSETDRAKLDEVFPDERINDERDIAFKKRMVMMD